jgi:phage terminase small subunit
MDIEQTVSSKEKVKEHKKKLTLKQRKWLKYYIETGNKTEAALKAYGLTRENQTDLNSAQVIGYENYKKLRLDELLEEQGLSDVILVKNLAVGAFKATKKLETKTITYEEKNQKITETIYIDIPDTKERRENTKILLELKGKLKNNTVNVDIDELNVLWGDQEEVLEVLEGDIEP